MRKGRITLERALRASIEDAWALWTTKAGLESWWGPDGFGVTVHHIDPRAGGELLYTMHARGVEQIAIMKRRGLPTSTKHRCTYTEVSWHRRLAYLHPADFIPGVEPYDVSHLVEFEVEGDVVRMRLTFDRMHDEEWTGRALTSWNQELARLGALLA